MNAFWFPDNTVLCNFGSINQVELLSTILRGRGNWTESVQAEAVASSRTRPALAGSALDFMGEAIEIDDPDEQSEIENLRRSRFGGTPNEPRKHLGEAETCYLLLHRAEYVDARWITDDRDAQEYARAQSIFTWDTMDLMSDGVASGEVSENDGYDFLLEMSKKGNHLRLPARPASLR